MNEIEKMFYKYVCQSVEEIGGNSDDIQVQKVIGIYKIDFYFSDVVIEIDGYEAHKTKEQREKDYKRERYLQKKGMTVVRFTGTEIFLSPELCKNELTDILSEVIIGKDIENIGWFNSGRQSK